METSIRIAISPSDRNSGRPNHLLQMPWIATGVVAGPGRCPRKAV